MDDSKNVPDLVAAAQANAKPYQNQITELLALLGGQPGTDAQQKELRDATAAVEHLAVDIFTVFEARMQHHFKRGPFSRKLKTLLIEEGQSELAQRIYQYYLAINVLKHGKGASHRELLKIKSPFIAIRPSDDADAFSSLIDATETGFFEGLCKAALDSYHFLENARLH